MAGVWPARFKSLFHFGKEAFFFMVTANDSYSGFIDYQEQIHRLRCKGIMIPDSVDAGETTLSILSTVPYRYLTNTFSKVRPILENEVICLEQLYFIHTEFNNLHTILLKYILIIEQSLKNKLSYIISKKYGVETDCNILFNKDPGDYLSVTHYSGDKSNRIAKIKQVIQKPYNGSSLEYYKNMQNIPPWIVLENLPLGKAINWYKILKNDDKTLVSKALFLFQPKNLLISDIKELVSKSLAILNEYRNMYAHRYREHQEYIKNELPFRPMLTEYKDVFFLRMNIVQGQEKKIS